MSLLRAKAKLKVQQKFLLFYVKYCCNNIRFVNGILIL